MCNRRLLLKFRTFQHPPTNPSLLSGPFQSPLPSPSGIHSSDFCLWSFAWSGHSPWVESYTMWPFVPKQCSQWSFPALGALATWCWGGSAHRNLRKMGHCLRPHCNAWDLLSGHWVTSWIDPVILSLILTRVSSPTPLFFFLHACPVRAQTRSNLRLPMWFHHRFLPCFSLSPRVVNRQRCPLLPALFSTLCHLLVSMPP